MSDETSTVPVNLPELFCLLQNELLASQTLIREIVDHPGTKGDASEINWIELLQKFLPDRYHVAKGFIVDSTGVRSQQQDIVIFDRQYSPFILNKKGVLYIPAESVYAIIEAKQELTRKEVVYASKKAASVRSLHRTSATIYHADGTYKPKKPFDIPAGIVTVNKGWAEPFGESMVTALRDTAAVPNGRINFGLVLDSGGFNVSYDSSGEPTVTHSEPSFSVMHFLLNLFRTLQFLGTVPAIDIQEYLTWLEKRDCPEEGETSAAPAA